MSQWTPAQQALMDTWQRHLEAEFAFKDVDRALATMTEDPYVICVPAGTGGHGREGVRRFYREDFFPSIPADMKLTPVSQIIAGDAFIEESVITLTHDVVMPWFVPGVPPTGRFVEFAFVAVVGFQGDKISYERLYWDQATVLVQLGLLDRSTPGVRGPEAAAWLRDPSQLP